MNNEQQPYSSGSDNPQDGMFQENSLDQSGQKHSFDMSQSDLVEAETAEQTYGSEKNSRVQKSTVMLMVACVLGVGGIYFFGAHNKSESGPVIDEEVEAKVDVALAKFQNNTAKSGKNILKDSEAMVKTFYEYSVKQQVGLDDLQRDPFARAAENKGPVVESDDAKQARIRRLLNEKLIDVKLQSILQGPNGGRCLVNGEVYGQGQIVRNVFTVKEITSDQVVLEAKGLTFTLKM